MRKVRNVEMCFGGRNGSQVLQRGGSLGHGERQGKGAHRGMHKENTSPKAISRKMKGADFGLFAPAKLKDWSFKGWWLGWDGALKGLPYSWREGRGVTWGQLAWSEECLRLIGETLFTLLRAHLWEVVFTKMPLWGQKAFSCTTPYHRHKNTC